MKETVYLLGSRRIIVIVYRKMKRDEIYFKTIREKEG